MKSDTRSLSELDMKPDEELNTWPHMRSVSEFDLKFRFKLLN